MEATCTQPHDAFTSWTHPYNQNLVKTQKRLEARRPTPAHVRSPAPAPQHFEHFRRGGVNAESFISHAEQFIFPSWARCDSLGLRWTVGQEHTLHAGRARAHTASTPGPSGLHSWRSSTRAGNFHGAEARAADGGRGQQSPGWLGASPSRRVVPGFLQLLFWAPSSP